MRTLPQDSVGLETYMQNSTCASVKIIQLYASFYVRFKVYL